MAVQTTSSRVLPCSGSPSRRSSGERLRKWITDTIRTLTTAAKTNAEISASTS